MSNWANTGPRTKRKLRRAAGGFLEDFGAENIGGHQIRCKLDAARIQAEDGAKRFDKLGFGETRHADQQAMAA